jgi:hypothetical protein
MPARGGDFDRPFNVLLTFDLAEIKFLCNKPVFILQVS